MALGWWCELIQSDPVPYSVEQIDRLLESPFEHQNLEFKEAKQQYDFRELCRYCVAMANEGGGAMVLGVSDQPPRQVVGTRACENVTGQAQKLLAKLGFRVDVEEVHHPDGRVVVLSIPPRPSGVAYNLDGAYWMRSGAALVPMSDDRLRVIHGEGRTDWIEEHSRTDLSAQDVIEALDTQTFFELINLPYPTERIGVLERLERERLIDRVGGTFAIRRIGALLLAKQLNEFPDLERKAPRVVAYTGTSKLETRLDRIGEKGYAVGFKGLVRFVMTQLPQNEVIQDALRREIKLVPEVVIRELVANALMHQDLVMAGASVMIEIYSNRLEISNPGEPLVPVERFIDGVQSRNERLAGLVRRMGICEEKGSGIDRVVHAAEVFQLPAPDFRAANSRTLSVIYGLRKFEEMDREDRIRACYQHCALRYVMSERMTNQTLRERFRLPESKSAVTSQVISAAIDSGLVKADEAVGTSRKFARYLPFWA